MLSFMLTTNSQLMALTFKTLIILTTTLTLNEHHLPTPSHTFPISEALQDDVPNTISDLMLAGIKLWVLTGDKMETAINIGYSCKLLKEDMTLIKLAAKNDDPESIKIQLLALCEHFGQITSYPKNFLVRFAQNTIGRTKKVRKHISKSIYRSKHGSEDTSDTTLSGNDETNDNDSDEENETQLPEGLELSQLESQHMALIIDGPSLLYVLGDPKAEKMLLSIACLCKAVIACRVSPSQKALMVRLVKDNIKPLPMTLAIGDGANDVGMIQEAQVGVGISGKEGRQAVNSSDFAIAQFKFLRRLLLVHGRWNYRRLSKCILFSFYKNIVLTMILFYFEAFAAFSGKSLFEDMVYSGYNFFLGMPPLMLGMFDRDMSQRTVLRFNKLYMSGRERMDLNVPTLASWMVQGVIDALIIFFMVYAVIGDENEMFVFGTTVYAALLLSMFYRIAAATYTWNFILTFFWVGSMILFGGIFMPIYSNWMTYAPSFYGTGIEMIEMSSFWLILFLVPTTVLMLDLSRRLTRTIFFATPIDHGIELDRGITHDVKEMMKVYEGDEEAISHILGKRGEVADDGMYRWWMAFSNKLPKFRFNRKQLRMLNEGLDKQRKSDMGIVDTEVDKNISSYAFDHVSKDFGIGGGERMKFNPPNPNLRQTSVPVMSSNTQSSFRGLDQDANNAGLAGNSQPPDFRSNRGSAPEPYANNDSLRSAEFNAADYRKANAPNDI